MSTVDGDRGWPGESGLGHSKHYFWSITMLKQIGQFLRDEEGASAVEYGLIVGLIAVAIVATLVLIGPKLNNIFTKVSTNLTTAGG